MLIAANEALDVEKQISLSTAQIQEMVSGTFTNNGFIIIADIEDNDRFSYRTSDAIAATKRPKLVIEYSASSATSTPTPAVTNTPTNTPTPGPSPTPTRTPTPTVASTATATSPAQAVFSSAAFTYDGDGARVKSVITTNIGTTTTYFVGNHYEVIGSTITKYYYAGAQRIAMRTNGTLNYLLGDHLGSTSLITDSSGVKTNEQRYKAWGETRYTFGSEKTKYQYTGQFSYTSDFGLYFYNARWFDPSLGRFAQADTIIPEQSQGVQAWDRYAYTNNNPVRYTDPSGHCVGPLALVCIGTAVVGALSILSSVPSDTRILDENPTGELQFWVGVSLIAPKIPLAEVVSNTYDCSQGFCDPNLMMPGSAAGYADAIDSVADDTLVRRTYTFGDESFEYTFDPNKRAALGNSEHLLDLSSDDYNILRNVPDEIYRNTTIQNDFLEDIVRSGKYPDLFSDKKLLVNRVFQTIEMPYLDELERTFGIWYSE